MFRRQPSFKEHKTYYGSMGQAMRSRLPVNPDTLSQDCKKVLLEIDSNKLVNFRPPKHRDELTSLYAADPDALSSEKILYYAFATKDLGKISSQHFKNAVKWIHLGTGIDSDKEFSPSLQESLAIMQIAIEYAEIDKTDLTLASLRAEKLNQLIEALKQRKTNGFINLSGLDLSHLSLENINFSNAHLIGVDLTHSNLTNVKMIDTDLSSSTLNHANFQHANLKMLYLNRATAREANFYGANLEESLLELTDMYGADLTDASFIKAHLSGLKLFGTNYQQANFSYLRRLDYCQFLDPETLTSAEGVLKGLDFLKQQLNMNATFPDHCKTEIISENFFGQIKEIIEASADPILFANQLITADVKKHPLLKQNCPSGFLFKSIPLWKKLDEMVQNIKPKNNTPTNK